MESNSSTSDKLLNSLFVILKRTISEEEAGIVEDMIWNVWMEGGSEETNTMMKRGCRFLENHNYDSAIRVFARMIRRNAYYAEAWNKRATAYYLRGDYKRSIDDIRHALRLEPRHFGALSGLASIYLVVGDQWGALKALERLYELRPNQPGLRAQINDLHVQILNERRKG
ncbi:MAG: tetratricopeptide repeat protein [Cytophagales bacterium]|jgi:tetratricopeptide (TPR) repeat protein|nr:tetratricopeptide repeat protein [Cytophagales bacterium]